MFEKIKSKLDEVKIKYEVICCDKMGVLTLKIDLSDNKDNTDLMEIDIAFKNIEEPYYILFNVSKVFDIPPIFRNKIKDYVLEFNGLTTCGAFFIQKRSKTVQFACPVYLGRKEGQAHEINKIPSYISLITDMIIRFRKGISEISNGDLKDETVEK